VIPHSSSAPDKVHKMVMKDTNVTTAESNPSESDSV
jgi:hypothetical protein